MYLTRVSLNQHRPETRRALSSPQVLHAAIMQCFSQVTLDTFESQGQRLLWTLEEGRDPLLFLLTPAEPDISHLVEQYGRPTDPGTSETKDLKHTLQSFQAGEHLQFRTTVNPVIRRGKDAIPVLTPQQREEWFAMKAPQWGFEVAGAPRMKAAQQLRFKKAGKHVTLASATFEGTLKITDLDLFLQSYRNGLGRGKAYGFGLLLLARIPQRHG